MIWPGSSRHPFAHQAHKAGEESLVVVPVLVEAKPSLPTNAALAFIVAFKPMVDRLQAHPPLLRSAIKTA